MKVAIKRFFELNGSTHGVSWGLCATVHDEVQIECEPGISDQLGEQFKQCITEAGTILNVKCPLAGAAKDGINWSFTH